MTAMTSADFDRVRDYCRDPLLDRLYGDIQRAGPIRSILLDITHNCNIRCKGCYFFAEEMDQKKSPTDESEFDAFLARETERGTNYVLVLGGEPSLALPRVQKVYQRFWCSVVTNGLNRIPSDGFENMSIAISVWGDHATDTNLRGNGKIEVFKRALANYKNDGRSIWYYTTTPGNASEIRSVVEQCVQNGNFLAFNFYSDLIKLGGKFDHRSGFARVRDEIDWAIDRYPERILMTSYLANVVSTGQLYDETWGYDVCGAVSPDNVINRERIKNGKPYMPHFRAYNPDLKTTRRCCVGQQRDCATCLDVVAHQSWIILNAAKHLQTRQEFTNWLTAVYVYYVQIRAIDFEEGRRLLPEIHRRVSAGRS
jgi:MoaA/NifB/PqqE/SkfB family radical SAM enzyme